MKVTVMGLGLHGGGLASARFFAELGAEVTVTDLRSPEVLAPSTEKLVDYPIRYVLCRHEIEDFKNADLVIKNPAVTQDSPFLKAARRVETDISIFLNLCEGPVTAVTGSKGKSTTASAIHHIVKSHDPGALLGGNITVSPLDFLLAGKSSHVSSGSPLRSPVILELSSWQLADLRGKGVLAPEVAVITNILNDHQNRYESMDHYISDKMVLFESQDARQKAIFNLDDPVLSKLADSVPGETLLFSSSRLPDGANGAFLDNKRGTRLDAGKETLLFDSTLLKGAHNHLNMLAATLACSCLGVPATEIRAAAASFPGIEHRLEYVATIKGVAFYNDSAATIPDATVAAAGSFDKPVTLIAGGTDKELDFTCLAALKGKTRGVYLLEGSATAKIAESLERSSVISKGPFSSLDKLMSSIIDNVGPGDIVVFSPGCTSFGMFLNEFDRGRQFKTLVGELKY